MLLPDCSWNVFAEYFLEDKVPKIFILDLWHSLLLCDSLVCATMLEESLSVYGSLVFLWKPRIDFECILPNYSPLPSLDACLKELQEEHETSLILFWFIMKVNLDPL